MITKMDAGGRVVSGPDARALDPSQALLIGEPTTGPWAISLTINCPCGLSFLWMGQPGPGDGEPGTIMPCSTCGRQYTLMDFPSHDSGDGNVRWKLLHTKPTKEINAQNP